MEAAHDDAEIIFGTVIDESIKDVVKVTVIATGLGGSAPITVSSPIFASAQIPSAVEVHAPAQEQSHAHAKASMSASSANTSSAQASSAQAHSNGHLPPLPNAAMLSNQKASGNHSAHGNHVGHNGHSGHGGHSNANSHNTSGDLGAGMSPEFEDLSPVKESSHLSGMSSVPAEGGELARARAIAQRLGITNLTDDEYEIPTYMRRQQERDI
jgi:cell division protein FtsZ